MNANTPTTQLTDDVLADIDDRFDAIARAAEPLSRRERSRPTHGSHRRRITIGAAALAVVGASLAVVQAAGDGSQPSKSQTDRPVDRDAITEDLVNRGLVPRQALDAASSSADATLRDLVNRGLVPRQALDKRPDAASND